ncbi:hypothetical protein PRIC2_014338 [Phytophthora ramorum]
MGEAGSWRSRGSWKPQAQNLMPLPTAGHEPAAGRCHELAQRLMKEGGADSVKVEGDKERPKTIKTIIDGGIAVTGHIGLRSQHTSVLEGLRAQGCTSIQARRFIEDALAVQKADVVSFFNEVH